MARQARRNAAGVLMVASLVGAGPPARQDSAVAPTRVIQYSPPATLPERTASGTCQEASRAAWFRDDAWRCAANSTNYDPCFRISVGQALCGVDPRQPGSGIVVTFTAPASVAARSGQASHHAWFFELTDGSTCQPLPAPGRELDGVVELYGCRFGSAGEADAVLGDLDGSAPVWTIRKVLINKKTEPQTIKSLMMASVRTVWR